MRRRQQQPSSPPQELTPDNGIDLTNELLDLHRHHQSRRRYLVPTEGPTRPAQHRWRPNRPQLAILESKVYYWFQNKKSRERRKRRQIEQEAAAAAAAAGGSAGEAAVGAAMQHPYDMTAGAANLYPSASASSGSDQLQPLGPVIDGASFLETEATGLIDLATSFGAGAAAA